MPEDRPDWDAALETARKIPHGCSIAWEAIARALLEARIDEQENPEFWRRLERIADLRRQLDAHK